MDGDDRSQATVNPYRSNNFRFDSILSDYREGLSTRRGTSTVIYNNYLSATLQRIEYRVIAEIDFALLHEAHYPDSGYFGDHRKAFIQVRLSLPECHAARPQMMKEITDQPFKSGLIVLPVTSSSQIPGLLERSIDSTPSHPLYL
jgi:hypothetical protein